MNQKKLMDKELERMSNVLRFKQRSFKTIKSYLQWLKRYIAWIINYPEGNSESKIESYLTHLAKDRNVSASTQNQALNAIIFYYKEVRKQEIGRLNFKFSSRPKTFPVVMTLDEVQLLRNHLKGVTWLVASIMYGCGFRLSEATGLRIKDIDFHQLQIHARCAKGKKDRTVKLPPSLVDPIKQQLEKSKRDFNIDRLKGNIIHMPFALSRKYPNANKEWAWQWLFPSIKLCAHPDNEKIIGRYHIHDSAIQRNVKNAVRMLGLTKKIGCHTFRHSYTTHLYEAGTDIAKIQQLLGHAKIETTMIYMHISKRSVSSIPGPLEMAG